MVMQAKEETEQSDCGNGSYLPGWLADWLTGYPVSNSTVRLGVHSFIRCAAFVFVVENRCVEERIYLSFSLSINNSLVFLVHNKLYI